MEKRERRRGRQEVEDEEKEEYRQGVIGKGDEKNAITDGQRRYRGRMKEGEREEWRMCA